jgi:hypothetical protein
VFERLAEGFGAAAERAGREADAVLAGFERAGGHEDERPAAPADGALERGVEGEGGFDGGAVGFAVEGEGDFAEGDGRGHGGVGGCEDDADAALVAEEEDGEEDAEGDRGDGAEGGEGGAFVTDKGTDFGVTSNDSALSNL